MIDDIQGVTIGTATMWFTLVQLEMMLQKWKTLMVSPVLSRDLRHMHKPLTRKMLLIGVH